MLLKRLGAIPAKRCSERCGLHSVVLGCLQKKKEFLKLVWNALCIVVAMCAHISIDGIAELWSHEERLDGAIKIARGSLIGQARVSRIPPCLLACHVRVGIVRRRRAGGS